MKTPSTILLTLALLCAVPCLALGKPVNTSTSSACPIEILDAAVVEPSVTGSIPSGYRVLVDFQNQSTKKIIGVSFGLDLMDAVGDWSSYPTNLLMEANLKPGKKNINNGWPIAPGQASGGRIYVKKIAFEDGTTWEDDGTKKCQYVKDNR